VSDSWPGIDKQAFTGWGNYSGSHNSGAGLPSAASPSKSPVSSKPADGSLPGIPKFTPPNPARGPAPPAIAPNGRYGKVLTQQQPRDLRAAAGDNPALTKVLKGQPDGPYPLGHNSKATRQLTEDLFKHDPRAVTAYTDRMHGSSPRRAVTLAAANQGMRNISPLAKGLGYPGNTKTESQRISADLLKQRLGDRPLGGLTFTDDGGSGAWARPTAGQINQDPHSPHMVSLSDAGTINHELGHTAQGSEAAGIRPPPSVDFDAKYNAYPIPDWPEWKDPNFDEIIKERELKRLLNSQHYDTATQQAEEAEDDYKKVRDAPASQRSSEVANSMADLVFMGEEFKRQTGKDLQHTVEFPGLMPKYPWPKRSDPDYDAKADKVFAQEKAWMAEDHTKKHDINWMVDMAKKHGYFGKDGKPGRSMEDLLTTDAGRQWLFQAVGSPGAPSDYKSDLEAYRENWGYRKGNPKTEYFFPAFDDNPRPIPRNWIQAAAEHPQYRDNEWDRGQWNQPAPGPRDEAPHFYKGSVDNTQGNTMNKQSAADLIKAAKGLAGRDGDGDGYVNDGKPNEKKVKSKVPGGLEGSYLADTMGMDAQLESTRNVLRGRNEGKHKKGLEGVWSAMNKVDQPLQEFARNSLANQSQNKATRWLSDFIPGDIGALVDLGAGIAGGEGQTDKARKQWAESGADDYRDKDTDAAAKYGKKGKGAFRKGLAGQLANQDYRIAFHKQQRDKKPTNYWLNPLDHTGPFNELGDRISRRNVAYAGRADSTPGTVSSILANIATLGIPGMIGGNVEAQKRTRHLGEEMGLYGAGKGTRVDSMDDDAKTAGDLIKAAGCLIKASQAGANLSGTTTGALPSTTLGAPVTTPGAPGSKVTNKFNPQTNMGNVVGSAAKPPTPPPAATPAQPATLPKPAQTAAAKATTRRLQQGKPASTNQRGKDFNRAMTGTAAKPKSTDVVPPLNEGWPYSNTNPFPQGSYTRAGNKSLVKPKSTGVVHPYGIHANGTPLEYTPPTHGNKGDKGYIQPTYQEDTGQPYDAKNWSAQNRWQAPGHKPYPADGDYGGQDQAAWDRNNMANAENAHRAAGGKMRRRDNSYGGDSHYYKYPGGEIRGMYAPPYNPPTPAATTPPPARRTTMRPLPSPAATTTPPAAAPAAPATGTDTSPPGIGSLFDDLGIDPPTAPTAPAATPAASPPPIGSLFDDLGIDPPTAPTVPTAPTKTPSGPSMSDAYSAQAEEALTPEKPEAYAPQDYSDSRFHKQLAHWDQIQNGKVGDKLADGTTLTQKKQDYGRKSNRLGYYQDMEAQGNEQRADIQQRQAQGAPVSSMESGYLKRRQSFEDSQNAVGGDANAFNSGRSAENRRLTQGPLQDQLATARKVNPGGQPKAPAHTEPAALPHEPKRPTFY